MSHDIFISYQRLDSVLAEKIRTVLEQNGLKCWMDKHYINPTERFAGKIYNGINEAKLFILIYSKNSQQSNYVRRELENAFNNKKHILAFNITDSEPRDDMAYYLKITQWMNAYPKPEYEFHKLIETCFEVCEKTYNLPIKWDLSDFSSEEVSKLKKDYTSLILLFTPLYWASFLYMGIVSNNNSWKIMSIIYLIPSIVCIILYFQIWGVLFVFYSKFLIFAALFIIFWIIAIAYGLLIRNEFLTKRAVFNVMPNNDELFNALYKEYLKL